MIGEGERVLLGIEQESEAAVLIRDELGIMALVGSHLEDAVPVDVLVVDPLLAGDESVGDGEDLLRLYEARVRISGPGRKRFAPH